MFQITENIFKKKEEGTCLIGKAYIMVGLTYNLLFGYRSKEHLASITHAFSEIFNSLLLRTRLYKGIGESKIMAIVTFFLVPLFLL